MVALGAVEREPVDKVLDQLSVVRQLEKVPEPVFERADLEGVAEGRLEGLVEGFYERVAGTREGVEAVLELEVRAELRPEYRQLADRPLPVGGLPRADEMPGAGYPTTSSYR